MAEFARQLRELRNQVGSPKYLQMARKSGRSRTALAEVAGGDHLPTWETVAAFVQACGADPAEWVGRWESVRDALDADRMRPVAPSSEAITAPQRVESAQFSRTDPLGSAESAATDVTILLRLWQEQREQARQCENHRTTLSAMLAAAYAALATASVLEHSRWLSAVFAVTITVLGGFGAVACIKY